MKQTLIFLNDFEFSAPKTPVIANLTARPYETDSDVIRDTLCGQIHSPVRWAETVRYARAEGAGDFQEFSPKPVLTNMLAKIV